MRYARALSIVLLYLAGISLGITGIVYLSEAGNFYTQGDHASRLMTNGYVCLSLGTLLFLTASILAFVAGARLSGSDRNAVQKGPS